jgi:hypothetical protein
VLGPCAKRSSPGVCNRGGTCPSGRRENLQRRFYIQDHTTSMMRSRGDVGSELDDTPFLEFRKKGGPFSRGKSENGALQLLPRVYGIQTMPFAITPRTPTLRTTQLRVKPVCGHRDICAFSLCIELRTLDNEPLFVIFERRPLEEGVSIGAIL